MIKYAQLINEETGLCSVGTGTNTDFYKSIGMVKLDVQQSDIDRAWYLAEKCPMKSDEEKEREERERLDMLFLTGADVERGIYQAKGMDFDDIMTFVMANPPVGLDIKALKIELKANNFYRGNPYVNAVGALLGFTSEQLDKFFADGNYEHLLPVEEETTEENSVVDEITEDEFKNNDSETISGQGE